MRSIIVKFRDLLFTPAFQTALAGLIIIVNIIWFVPTQNLIRQNTNDRQKLIVDESLVLAQGFFSQRMRGIAIPAPYITLPLQSRENEGIVRRILKEEYLNAITLADIRGDAVIAYDKQNPLFSMDRPNTSINPEFREALRTRKPTWSSVGATDRFEPVITLAVPVLSPEGAPLAVLLAEFSIRELFKALESQIDISHGSTIYVTDASGLLVSHSDHSLVLKNVNVANRAVVRDALALRGAVNATDDRYEYFNQNDIRVLAVAQYVESPPLAIVYEEPRSVAFHAMERIQFFFFTASLVLIGMVMILRRSAVRILRTKNQLEDSLHEQQKLLAVVEDSKQRVEETNRRLDVSLSDLDKKVRELEKFNRLMVERELRMAELKKEIAELKAKQT